MTQSLTAAVSVLKTIQVGPGLEGGMKTRLDLTGDVVSIAADICQIVAVIVGGWWAWRLFVRRREGYVRAVVTHSVSGHLLNKISRLVRVVIEIENVGEVAVRVPRMETTLQQILPLLGEALLEGAPRVEPGEVEVSWPVIARYQQDMKEEDWVLDPKERERLNLDFVINAEVTLVQVHTMAYCEDGPDAQFWENQEIVNLTKNRRTAT